MRRVGVVGRSIRSMMAATAAFGLAAGTSAQIAQSAPPPSVAYAEVTPPEPSGPDLAPSPSLILTESSPLLTAIRAEATARAAREPAPKEGEPATIASHVADFYGSDSASPIWVDDKGLTKKARDVIAQLTRAGDYGLDPAAFALPQHVHTASTIDELAAAEIDVTLAALTYVTHARGGRVDPSQLSLWLDMRPRPIDVDEVLGKFSRARDAASILLSYHPQHPQFELLRRAYLMERGDLAPAPPALVPPGERIASGERHPHVRIIRERLGLPAKSEANADLLDRTLMSRLRSIAFEAGLGRKTGVDDDVRALVNRITPPRTGPRKALLERYLVNLERWRHMPEDMGDFHIWNNLPEFMTRVVRDGEVIHQERIIIGKETTQTPVFSDEMTHVYFQPEWGVPESIKIRTLLPHLRGGDTGVLARRNMRIKDGERVISPSRFNWSKVDIRNVPIVQGPGSGNPLGQLKFMFPNKHDVYMHDTPDKHLFNASARTYSAGCIRVRDPQRFAEVILGQVDGWTASDVSNQLKIKTTRRVDFSAPVPVHNTYFTMWADANGRVTEFKDVYAHDQRITEALAGKSIKTIASRDPAMAQKRRNDELRRNVAVIRRKPRTPPAATFAAVQPFPPGSQFKPMPFKPYGLGKPPKKYSSPVPPPRLLWFQQF